LAFLYKHYEKIVLAVFLLVFVFALVYLIMVFSQSKDISEEDLRIRPQGEDYTCTFDEKGKEIVADGEKGRYAVKDDFKDEKEWVVSKQRDPESIAFSDFMVPFKAARCEMCKRVVPKAAFDNKMCPLCKKPPGRIRKKVIVVDEDTDKDGMLDKFEKRIEGLNFAIPFKFFIPDCLILESKSSISLKCLNKYDTSSGLGIDVP